MDVYYLNEDTGVDRESECVYQNITSIRNCYSKLHIHDFFEIMYVVSGMCNHYINNTRDKLEEGTLVFFRPQDTHRLEQMGCNECHLINIPFMRKTFQCMLDYLGPGFDASGFLTAKMPYKVILSDLQQQKLMGMLEYMNSIPAGQKSNISTTLRFILLELFFNYLHVHYKKDYENMPEWLMKLCIEMKKKENFTADIARLAQLSGKNHSYICRVFKKYFNTTPSKYINEIRMSYAQNLLVNSDMSIINICLDIGFESLGHFYKIFEKMFGIPPSMYRKKCRNNSQLWI